MLVALHVGQFAFAGIVAAVIVGLATAVASRRVGEREGISEARVTTLIKAEGVVEPVLKQAGLGCGAASPRSLSARWSCSKWCRSHSPGLSLVA